MQHIETDQLRSGVYVVVVVSPTQAVSISISIRSVPLFKTLPIFVRMIWFPVYFVL